MTTATKPAKIVPKFRFRLNQSWNGGNRGDVITVGPGLLDALQRGNRGELVQTDPPADPGAKMARAARIENKALAQE